MTIATPVSVQVEPWKSAVKSALMPGVELDVEDGVTNVIADLSDIARGDMAGYNGSKHGRFRRLVPRMSRADYEALKVVEIPNSPVSLRDVLAQVPGMRDKDIEEFVAGRRLGRVSLEGGGYKDVVLPNITAVTTEMELIDAGQDGSVLLPDLAEVKQRAKTRKYTLTQVMNDADVRAKYAVPMRTVATAQRLAVTDPHAAAQVYQDAMNACQDRVRVFVVPGVFAIDNVQACNAIRTLSYGAVVAPSSIKTEVIGGKKIFMYCPDDDVVGWHLAGPLQWAAQMVDLYRMVMSMGPHVPSVILAVDLVRLGIDIYDGTTYAEPVLKFNASTRTGSPVEVGVAEAAAKEMTASQRVALAGMKAVMLPIVAADGRQLATAVRVTDRHVLVNDHVVCVDKHAKIDGEPVLLSSRVSRDVWAAECLGNSGSWKFRPPVVGERAVVVYLAEGRVSCSSPVVIQSIAQDIVMTSVAKEVINGVSGGALLALKDFGFLGIHSAVVGSQLMNYRFGPDEISELQDADAQSSISRRSDSEGFAAAVVRRFSDKGLGSTFKTAAMALRPLARNGNHVGMSVVDAGKAFTSVNDVEGLVWLDTGESAKFRRGSSHSLYEEEQPGTSAMVPLRRPARLGEKVFVLGYDNDLYVTKETTVAHVYNHQKGFVLRFIQGIDKPLEGGIVMAWDGSVLGMCGTLTVDTPVGYGLRCHVLPEAKPGAAPDARRMLAESFPFLSTAQWSDDLLEEVFTHASAAGYKTGKPFNVGFKPLGVIGDGYLKTLNSKVLRQCGVPHPRWAKIFEAYNSNVAMAPVAHRFGLDKCVVVGPGIRLSYGSKAYADLIEALVGAATLVEADEIVGLLCRKLGLVYTEDVDYSESVSGVDAATDTAQDKLVEMSSSENQVE